MDQSFVGSNPTPRTSRQFIIDYNEEAAIEKVSREHKVEEASYATASLSTNFKITHHI